VSGATVWPETVGTRLNSPGSASSVGAATKSVWLRPAAAMVTARAAADRIDHGGAPRVGDLQR
jgi:hypothetical protein